MIDRLARLLRLAVLAFLSVVVLLVLRLLPVALYLVAWLVVACQFVQAARRAAWLAAGQVALLVVATSPGEVGRGA